MLIEAFSIFFKLVPGIFIMFAVAVLARGGTDLGLPWWQGLESLFASNPVTNKFLIDILHLNYILISILIGMLLRNLVGIPDLLMSGIRTSRLFIRSICTK